MTFECRNLDTRQMLNVLNDDDVDVKELANHHSLREKMLKHQRSVQNEHLCDREWVKYWLKVEREQVMVREMPENQDLSAKMFC